MTRMKGRHRIGFAAYPFATQTGGVARGYRNLAFRIYHHMRESFGDLIVPIAPGKVQGSPKAVLHVCPPHIFQPIPGKRNILFTMWETTALPPALEANMKRADAVIAPSRFCFETFVKAGMTVAKTPLGVPDYFLDANPDRSILDPNRKLRILWVGAPSERKGWKMLQPALGLAFQGIIRAPHVYVKTISEDKKVAEVGNCTVDTRDLEEEAMMDLYLSADVILSTSFGEGFGLTVLEGMALGCLAVAPIAGGHAEFLNPKTGVIIPNAGVADFNYGTPVKIPIPSPKTIAVALRWVAQNWGTPQCEGRRRAGVKAARSLTWTKTARQVGKLIWNEPLSTAA